METYAELFGREDSDEVFDIDGDEEEGFAEFDKDRWIMAAIVIPNFSV